MSSCASDPLSEIPQGLKDLFSWNPPELYLFTGKKTTTETRPPAFYDKHFSQDVKLLCVKRLPSLARDIASNVDKTIVDYINDGIRFPPSDILCSAQRLAYLSTNVDQRVVDEMGVSSFYDKTTGTFCAPVASTLALRSSDWRSLLQWTQSSKISGYAIADGFLTLMDLERLNDAKKTQLKEVMGDETLEHLRDFSKLRASLATYVFKNLAGGGVDIMLEIPNLSNSPTFDWIGCEVKNCISQIKHVKEREKVVNVVKGFDAKNTPWNLDLSSKGPISPSDAETVRPQPPTGSSSVQGSSKDVGSSKAIKRKRAESSASSLLSTLGTSQASSSLAPEASSVSEIPTMGREFRRSSGLAAKTNNPNNVTKSTDRMLALPVPVVRKGKGNVVVKGNVQGGGDDEYSKDPSYKSRTEVSAHSIVQQAWAQATQDDCSIIVIQSGDHEFIGIRHRATQTLYISDVIEPHACKEPSYGKIHVGIYIAAIRDALERKRQQWQADTRPPGGGNGLSGSGGDKQDGLSGGGPGRGHRDDVGGGSKGDHKIRGGTKRSKEAHETAITAHKLAAKSTLELASGRDVILLYLQYGIYDSSAPSIFVRSGSTGCPTPLPSRETVQNYQLEECLTIVLKSEIGHGATGQVFRGTLEVEASECASLDVAVKLALGTQQCEALRNECEMYHRLRLEGVTAGITEPLGFFDYLEGEGCILVMPYVGTPLGSTPGLVLPTSYREAVLATLAEIHHANILHGDLCLANILVADSGLTIIDFSYSQVCVNQRAKKKEYLELYTLLDSTLLFAN